MPVEMPSKYAQTACGVKDESAKFPEPVHYDCAECKGLVRDYLLLRGPAPKFPQQPQQTGMDWGKGAPKRRRKERRGAE